MNDESLRQILIDSLNGQNAHLSLQSAIKNLKPENRNVKPSADLHSVWQLIEHIRISQEDIIRYTIDPAWKSPEWPKDYWPDREDKISDEEWNFSVSKINDDLTLLVNIINDKSIDLTSIIPHSENHTYLREAILVIDHNSYHIAQIVQTRKQIGDWYR